MQRYIIGLHVFGFLPLFYAIIYYIGDVWAYLTSDDEEELEQIELWQVKVYTFFFDCFTVFSCIFCFRDILMVYYGMHLYCLRCRFIRFPFTLHGIW